MHEPDVTLTDYLLALECLIFVGLIFRTHAAHAVARVGLLGVFGSLAAAAILGGTSHGFFPDHESAAYKAIWIATMLSIGAATWGAWIVFAWTSFAASTARVVTIVTALIFAAYATYVIFIDQPYLAAIAHYALVSLALMIVFAVRAAQSRARPAVLGLLGLVLTFVAAFVQQAEIGLHPVYMTHNALYHLIQAVGFYLFYRGGVWLCDQPLLFKTRAAST